MSKEYIYIYINKQALNYGILPQTYQLIIDIKT